MEVEKISACRVCGGLSIKPFFDLGDQPLANSLPASAGEKENFYPLSLSFCTDCNLVQLNHTVDPKILFSQYVWVTGTSKTANDFSEKFYKELIARRGSEKGGYVLEVASNDGTFLRPFMRDGYVVLGIDPAKNIAEIANKNGVPTEPLFFANDIAKDIVEKRGQASMIFARNVLAHVANPHDFTEGMYAALADDGVLAIEVHYAKIILEGLHYDSIYHEHLCYFTLKSLEKLLGDHGLYVFDVIASPISGGAMIVYARKTKTEPSERVYEYRNQEKESKTNELASWQEFAKRSFAHKEKLLEKLGEIKKKLLGILEDKKMRVVGWGSSARSSTMLNFCGVDSRMLPVIIDLNPLKQGRWTAGTRIPIAQPEAVLGLKPDYVLILAWNFADEIMEMLKTKYNFRGRCIIPLPEFKVVDMSK